MLVGTEAHRRGISSELWRKSTIYGSQRAPPKNGARRKIVVGILVSFDDIRQLDRYVMGDAAYHCPITLVCLSPVIRLWSV